MDPNRSPGPDGNIDANDMTFLSDNAIPRVNYGINLDGEWKGITLSLLFQGVGSYDKILSTKDTPNGGVFQGGQRPYFELWVNHWTPENPNAPYPRAAAYSWNPYGIIRFEVLDQKWRLPQVEECKSGIYPTKKHGHNIY